MVTYDFSVVGTILKPSGDRGGRAFVVVSIWAAAEGRSTARGRRWGFLENGASRWWTLLGIGWK